MSAKSQSKLSHPPFLGGLTAQDFLDQYWQKQPLFIPNGFPDLIDCISADELAGYALEEQVESRIIIEKANNQWELQHGPFAEADFSQLPQSHWTLLIQALDHYAPEFAELLDQFNFIPQWRIDDIMMSYATTGGSVGPHYDYYDVFLIQISGKRHWKIGQHCNDDSPIIPNLPVRILKTFATQFEKIVKPGDVLYLPPGVAHHGVALDDECITLSVGFRSPSYADIISEYSHAIAAALSGSNRYEDSDLIARTEFDPTHNSLHSGLVTDRDVARVQTKLMELIADPAKLKRWLGEYVSLPKYDNISLMPSDLSIEEMLTLLQQNTPLYRDESSRFVIIQNDSLKNNEILFINGQATTFPQTASQLANLIASKRVFSGQEILHSLTHDDDKQWLHQQIASGVLYFPNDEE